MKKDNIKSTKKEDLVKDLNSKQIALRDIRFGTAHSKSKNVKQYANLKKEIARINTILNSKIEN